MMLRFRIEKSINVLMEWRKEVITAVFNIRPDTNLLAANRKYYDKHLSDDTHVAIIAHDDENEYGCGAICLTEELPSPENPDGKCAYLMNIFVRETFRNKGIGHAIVRRLIEVAKGRGCGKIYLETTSAGRPVYKSIGFKEMPDLMKYYEPDI